AWIRTNGCNLSQKRLVENLTVGSREMPPTFRVEDGFMRAIDQENLVFESGIDDFADARDRNALDHRGKVISDDDQFVLFTTVEEMVLLDASRRRKAILIDSRGDFGFVDDMSKVRGETIADVDHGVGAGRNGRAYAIPGFRIEM